MTYDPKRTECERKLEHCGKERQNYLEAYHGYYFENTKLKRHLKIAENRIKKLKKAKRASFLPLRGIIYLED